MESKYRRGFLNAVSVGIDFVDEEGGAPLNWWNLTPKQISTEAFYDLAEHSAVTVPADPKAVIEQSRQGLAHLGRELVELFDETQRPASRLPAAAVLAELDGQIARFGVDPHADPRAAEAIRAAFGSQLASNAVVQILATEAGRRARREFVEECRRREAEPWTLPR
ncbi:MAG: hypothetical protein ACRDRG_17050 [Pseudonocardiaceae bacterium]